MSTIRFYTEGLLSKWGFSDGDLLDDFVSGVGSGKRLLEVAVQRFVVPRIRQKLEIQENCSICHNPIRALSVDDKPVDLYNVDWARENGAVLDPEYVDISEADIRALAVELGLPLERWGHDD